MTLGILKRVPLMGVALLALFTTANAQDGKPTVYKISEAGIQLNLPSGWKAEKDSKGVILISKKDGDGYVLFSMNVLPRDPAITFDQLFAAFSEGVFESAKKDWKGFKSDQIRKDTQGGMALRVQKFDGAVADAGGDLEGLVVVIDSPKPLGIFAQRTKKHSEVLENEGNAILTSIAKIQ